jgi:hypothetical protein
MNAAALGHQYLSVKTNINNESYFGSGQKRTLQRNQIRNIQSDRNKLITPATDPLTRRSTLADESKVPSVAVITRSLSDSNSPYVVYDSAATNTSEYQ